ncbi:zinc ribbon domain-containing protein [Flavobacterium sp.]|uniref:zinc ribbon domain-containing protein n=1 Tax=Flavobacterium sp. TaxID=239 RepID=UPI003267E8CC
MMLAFYLAATEVENDRRVLNVFYGMCRTKKVGRYMGLAPLGYICGCHLPLRGYLLCPECGKLLTGSPSKGRNQYYRYYHCASSCGVRF